ncbi:flagellar biosynthesis; hook protein [Xenorhabdus nematophila ATCC 19061]|uniref:Flagellar hook protein FlgE n=2 Tax=Xenorhabdus nematophila TaxID=628 RepID=D3VCD2_XENNA|nr:flagellar hook protein FlgE [Xenorhabdus nematophila]ABO77656.1 FlgE [Xenorhabdus nematophila]CBJ89785.1 flagellar biosynthesis; hook protein [Xenorhabdus nematophila ATCC 19061]CEK22670.1 flagellar biosynthesis; hook protein [Xenorhabdus nematophila AN6/1]
MSFSQAVSGLNAAASNLDVIGNNISNSATFGFKSSSAAFADVFSGSEVGLGVKVSGMVQNFKDGSTTTTNRKLDMAINQGGFFRMQDSNGNILYSRNGQFKMDEDRNLINMQGMKLTGYPAVNGEIQIGGAVGPISIPTDMLDAKATTEITLKANLSSMETAITGEFDPDKKDTFNYSAPLQVFDSLGNQHDINVFFVKTDNNKWTAHALDRSVAGAKPQELGELEFNTSGQMKDIPPFKFEVPALNGSAAAQINIELNGSKQQSIAQNSISPPKQDGYAAGHFTDYRVDDDGKIYGVYSNDQKQVLGQIVLANFANPEGLAAQGDNVWAESGASGSSVIGVAGSGNLGNLISGALEASNVDMSQELVNMIVSQRNYQSNAQTIKTQDQILQTLVSMR